MVWQDIIVGSFLSDAIVMVQTRPLYVVVLDPAPEAIADRERRRAKVGYDNDWDVAQFVNSMRATTPRIGIGLWIDNSTLTAEQTAQAVLDRLERARI